MKKSLLSMLAAAAGLLMATSCSNELDNVKVGGEATVTFTAQLPSGVNSRAPQKTTEDAKTTFGDGTTAANLQYAVYKVTTDAAGNKTWAVIDELCDSKTINLTTTVSLQLVNGNTYAVAFWADATTDTQKSIYTFNKTNCTITADYSEATTSNESYDAFYAIKEFVVNGSSQETVKLTRPFAQLNIGTADLDAAEKAGQKVSAAGINVKVANTLNLKDGKVSGEEVITFTQATLPKDKKFPVDNYSYLTMNYLLVSADKTSDNTVTISYDAESGVQERVFNNVPLQRNYRTNIYGNLLTSTTDFNVVIVPGFEKDDNDVEITWNGTATRKPKANDDGVLEIYYPSEWAYLCNSSEATGAKTVNQSIELKADLDFGGHDLTPFKLGKGVTVDGNGYAIMNARLVGDRCEQQSHGIGTFHASLFCAPSGEVTVQNLTVKGGSVYCPNEDGDPDNIKGHAAVIFATIEEKSTVNLKGVHVIGVNIYGIQPVAGLIGRTGAAGPTINIDDCSVEECYLHNKEVVNESGYVASFIGRRDNTAATVTITNSTSKNNTIDAYWAARRGENSIQEIAAEGIVITGVVASGNTVKKTKVSPDAIVSTTDELVNALKQSYNSKIQLKAGTYSIDNSTGLTGNKTIQLIGESKEKTILTITEATYQEGAKLSFENLTMTNQDLINDNTGSYEFMFYRAAELNLTNCNVNGAFKTTATKTVIDGCTFANTRKGGMNGYPIFLYHNDLVIKNSDVTGVEKGILVYNDGAAVFNVTVENCKFHATSADDKAAIEMHTEHGISGNLTINKTEFTGFYTTVGAGAGLWNECNNSGTPTTPTTRFTVVVDGKTVQTASL